MLGTLRTTRLRMPAALGLLLLSLAACATPEPLPLPERQPIPHGQGRIWQVDRPGLEPSYLFGTIHVSDPRVLSLPDAAEVAFVGAKIAAFETGFELESEEEQQEAHFMLPEGQSLSGLLGFWTYNRLRNLAQFRVFTLKHFDQLQPWVIWLLIADREVGGGFKEDPEKPVLDNWLQTRAMEAGKEVVALETAEEQMAIFAEIPMEDQVSMLKSAVDEYYGPRTRVDQLQLYLEGDLELRYALWWRFLSHLEPDVAQRFHERIGTNRNRIMAERLLPVFARGSTFVAVGTMHLPGEDGILALLEQQGFTVTRLH